MPDRVVFRLFLSQKGHSKTKTIAFRELRQLKDLVIHQSHTQAAQQSNENIVFRTDNFANKYCRRL